MTIRRFPEEEGTEIPSNGKSKITSVTTIRRFPDEEGTEIPDVVAEAEAWLGERSEDSPMRRGLKYGDAQDVSGAISTIRRFPDEEGTEISRDSRSSSTRPGYDRSEDSPMRRGLKSERG